MLGIMGMVWGAMEGNWEGRVGNGWGLSVCCGQRDSGFSFLVQDLCCASGEGAVYSGLGRIRSVWISQSIHHVRGRQ